MRPQINNGLERADSQTFPQLAAHIRGKDLSGKRFREETRIDSLSATGAYFRVPIKIYQGASLQLAIGLSAHARMILRGTVRRVDLRPDNQYGVVLQITRYRLV